MAVMGIDNAWLEGPGYESVDRGPYLGKFYVYLLADMYYWFRLIILKILFDLANEQELLGGSGSSDNQTIYSGIRGA